VNSYCKESYAKFPCLSLNPFLEIVNETALLPNINYDPGNYYVFPLVLIVAYSVPLMISTVLIIIIDVCHAIFAKSASNGDDKLSNLMQKMYESKACSRADLAHQIFLGISLPEPEPMASKVVTYKI